VQWIERFTLLSSATAERLPEQFSRFRTFVIWSEGLLH
jgi:hypothetical protein